MRAFPWLGAFFVAFFPIDACVQAEDAKPSSSESASRKEGGVSYFSFFSGWPSESYALDAVERFVPGGKRFRCSTEGIERYRARSPRYRARVHRSFIPRLQRLEALLARLATETYGRPPKRLVHRGAYSCRRARGREERISEHALGNAIDLHSLEFGPLPRDAAAPSDLPRALRRGFRVSIGEHWSPRRERDVLHARFLHRLAEELRQRPDIFRGIVGPPRPRHRDHLHLDASPWRYAMFAYEP